MLKETELYQPVKDFLEGAGYEVKSEIAGCDVVACKPGTPMVIVELKTVFSLDLVLQGVERQAVAEDVYLAVRTPETLAKRKNWRKRRRPLLTLCKKLGLGLILVDPTIPRPVEVLLDPAPYQPQKNRRQQARLKKEFYSRTGDPNTGGASQSKIITAYRQDALRCAAALQPSPYLALKFIRDTTGVRRAASILQNNHYGWFERVSRGVYALTGEGHAALQHYAEVVAQLRPDVAPSPPLD
ncbi:MAG: DUF2161 family putative PD-(D/E)XK-type phosphodiesterase [Rhodospirillales bacterium]|nr:DUF2161 family putative PD-(D/E)XK-type phosphodiesterase [Rhodospirillales bacterium]